MKPGSSQPSHQESLPPCSDEVGLSKLFFECLIILFLSSTTPTILRFFPQVKVEGGIVPVIFRDRPTYYHMFVISTVFAFTGASSALVIRRKRKPRVEIFCRISAMASMLSALAIVLDATAQYAKEGLPRSLPLE